VRVLALTRHAEQGYLRRLMQTGAAGYVLKRTAADELITAIRVITAGGTYMDAGLAGGLVESRERLAAAPDAARWQSQLSPREAEVLRHIAWGRSNEEIAAQLSISVKTVEFHKANALKKLGLRTRTDILRYAIAQGWLEEEHGPA
jgi:DNA-binding NarL/FixJ family response regulator